MQLRGKARRRGTSPLGRRSPALPELAAVAVLLQLGLDTLQGGRGGGVQPEHLLAQLARSCRCSEEGQEAVQCSARREDREKGQGTSADLVPHARGWRGPAPGSRAWRESTQAAAFSRAAARPPCGGQGTTGAEKRRRWWGWKMERSGVRPGARACAPHPPAGPLLHRETHRSTDGGECCAESELLACLSARR